MSRICGECTACCEGWLIADINGVHMEPGKPCYLLQIGKGCTDYENRPQNPCKGFECEWLRQPDLYPEEMRPDRARAIFSRQEVDGVQYLRITEMGKRLDAEVLSHGVKITLGTRGNLYWEVDGKMHWFGNKGFIDVMNKHKQQNLKL